MTTLEQWDELLTCSPMSPQEALRSVRIKPAEIKAIQDDARADLLERIKTLGEALTQYRVALERWKWKPMDTAPKDGTRVLLLTSETCYVGYWSNSLWVSNAWIIYDTRSLKPDYWMPLPDPPATPLIEKGRK